MGNEELLKVFTENFVVVVFIACLVVGYIIKHATILKKVPNNDIPVILACFGAILNALVNGISVDSIVYGAFMGLASTGAHQMFTRFVEGNAETGDIEEGE